MKKILCLILATVFVLAFASCGEPESFDPIKGTESGKGDIVIMSHKEFIAANVDTPVTVETFVQAKQSWWEGKASFYTQAEDGAYFIYQMPCTKEEYDALGVGTKIRVSGKKAEWSGEIEIADATFTVLDGNYVAEPLDVTALLGTDELASHQNEYVSFKNMTVEAKQDAQGKEAAFLYNWDGTGKEGDDLYFDVSSGGNKFTFTVESYLCSADTEVYKAVKELKVGDVVNLTGFLYWYEGPNPHITAVSAAD